MHNIISIKNNDMLNPIKNKGVKKISNIIQEQGSSMSDLQSNQQNISKILPNIKFNDKKIMAYTPLTESNRNHSFNSNNYYQKVHNQSKDTNVKMGKSTSTSNFKQVVDRLNQSYSARIKTELDKENQLKKFMPNKTLSSNQLKKAYSIQRQIKKPRYFDKGKNHLNFTQSQHQATNFTQTQLISKNKSICDISSHMNSSLRQNDKIVSVLTSMTKKQQYIASQRAKYERKIKELKAKILQEKMLLGFSQKNYQKALNDINQKQQYERQFNNQSMTSIKKRQIIESEVKLIRGKFIDASLQKNEVTAQIKEEKQLIDNYTFVIEELKQQLKLQTQEKIQIQKKLTVLKKSEKIQALKKTNQTHTTEDLINTVYSSLKKWV